MTQEQWLLELDKLKSCAKAYTSHGGKLSVDYLEDFRKLMIQIDKVEKWVMASEDNSEFADRHNLTQIITGLTNDMREECARCPLKTN